MDRKKLPKLLELVGCVMDDPFLSKLLARMGIFLIDYKGKRSLANDLWKKLGYPDKHTYEKTWTQFLHPEDRKRVESGCQDLFAGTIKFFRDIYRIKDRSDRWRWISNRSTIIHRDEGGSPWIHFGVEEDLTRIKYAQEKASQRAREASTLNATIEEISSSLDLDETVRKVLQQARRVVPYERATLQVLHKGSLEILGGIGFSLPEKYENLKFPYPEEGSLSTRAIQERRPCISKDVTRDFPRFFHVEGEELTRSWIGAPLIAHGDVIGLISFDSTERDFYKSRHLEMARAFAGSVAIVIKNARTHGETYKLAMKDALTGIGSRHAFDLTSRFLFEKACREGREFALAMLDLDHFKNINDHFGHQVGDKVIQAVSKVCENGLRSTDLIARYGGEEIVIFLPDTSVETAVDIVERIRIEVERLRFKGIDRPVTMSGGISGCGSYKRLSLVEIIREADAALYRAKAQGRNRTLAHEKN